MVKKKGLIGDIGFRRKGMTKGIDSSQKAMTEGIAFRRKAMTLPINIIVTLIILLAVALIVIYGVAKPITSFFSSSDDQLDTSTDASNCKLACSTPCSAGFSDGEATSYVQCKEKTACDPAAIDSKFQDCACLCAGSGSTDPDPAVECLSDSDCSYSTQFCCDSHCNTDACIDKIWTNNDYKDDTLYGCGHLDGKTYLYCFIGPNVWDESTTKYTFMCLPFFIVTTDLDDPFNPVKDTEISNNEITGDILKNGGTGIVKGSVNVIKNKVVDINKKYAYIPATAFPLPNTDIMLLNQDSINLIVGQDPQLKPAFQGDIQIQFT